MLFPAIIAAIVEILTYFTEATLTKFCPSPWEPYVSSHGTGMYAENWCHKKCMGNALFTNDGEFICFNKKDVAIMKPNFKTKSKKEISCKCGYFTKGVRKSWTACNTPTIEATGKSCKEHCEHTWVYSYKRRKQTILHCELGTRNEFYEVKGEIGEQLSDLNVSKSDRRLCTCGVVDMTLKQIRIDVENTQESAKVFMKCQKPWETITLYEVYTQEKCEIFCQDACARSWGFLHNGKPFCYRNSVPAKRRSPNFGRIDGTCECGYTKFITKTSQRIEKSTEFIPCQPPIIEYISNATLCVEFCLKSRVYLHRTEGHKLNFRCIFQPDHELQKPLPLTGKCDGKIHDCAGNSRKYMECFCGLKNPLDIKIFINKTESEIDIMKDIGNSWSVKKKRSSRNYNKANNTK